MRVFASVFKIHLKREFSYKSALLSGLITQLFFGFMQISLYMAFLKSGNSDFTVGQMVSYIWLQQSFFGLFMFWDNQKYEITEKIVKGDVGYHLIKPIGLYDYWFYNIFSKGVATSMLRSLPIILIGLCLPSKYALMFPQSIEGFVMFLLSMILGALLVSSVNTLSHIIVLYTLSPKGIFSFMVSVAGLLAGQVVPIPMLPKSVQKVFYFFPFRYVSDLPYRLYVGNISGLEGLKQIAIQLVWFVLILTIGKLILRKKVNALAVQGG